MVFRVMYTRITAHSFFREDVLVWPVPAPQERGRRIACVGARCQEERWEGIVRFLWQDRVRGLLRLAHVLSSACPVTEPLAAPADRRPPFVGRSPVIAKRAQEIAPFLAMEVLERAVELEAKGDHIVHLEVGEPDFPTPACIQDAAARAVKGGKIGYTHSLGILPLREAIAEHYHRKYGVQVSPERILVTAGTSPAMWMVFSAILEPGDQVILSNPHYACYPNFIRFCGGEPVTVAVHEDDGFQFRPEAVQGRPGPRTQAIFINSPP